MKKLQIKLNSKKGATILLALLFLLVTVMVGTLMLSASLTSIEQVKANKEEQQAYLTVSSAAQLVADILESEQSNYELRIYSLNDSIETNTVIDNKSGSYLNDKSIFSQFVNEGVEKLDDPTFAILDKPYTADFTIEVPINDGESLDTVNGVFSMEKNEIGRNTGVYAYNINVTLEDSDKYRCTISLTGTKGRPTYELETDTQQTKKLVAYYSEVAEGTVGDYDAEYKYVGTGNGEYKPQAYTDKANSGEKNYNALYTYLGSRTGDYDPQKYTTDVSMGDKNYKFEYVGSNKGNYIPATYDYQENGNYTADFVYGGTGGQYEPVSYYQSSNGQFMKTDELVPYGFDKNYLKYYYLYLQYPEANAYKKDVSFVSVGSGSGEYEEGYFVRVNSGYGLYNISNGVFTAVSEGSSGNYIRITENEDSYIHGSSSSGYYIFKSRVPEDDRGKISSKITSRKWSDGSFQDVYNLASDEITVAYGKKAGGGYSETAEYKSSSQGNYIRITESTKDYLLSEAAKSSSSGSYYYISAGDSTELKAISNSSNKSGSKIIIAKASLNYITSEYDFFEVTPGTGTHSIYYNYVGTGGNYNATGYKKVDGNDYGRFKAENFKAVEEGKGLFVAASGTSYTLAKGYGSENPYPVSKGLGTHVGIDPVYVGSGNGTLEVSYKGVNVYAKGTGQYAGTNYAKVGEGFGDSVISGYKENKGNGRYEKLFKEQIVYDGILYDVNVTKIDWKISEIKKGEEKK